MSSRSFRWRAGQPSSLGHTLVAVVACCGILAIWMVTVGYALWAHTMGQRAKAHQLQKQYQAWRLVLEQLPHNKHQLDQLMRCHPDCPQRWPAQTQGAELLDQVQALVRAQGIQGAQLSVAATSDQGQGWQRWPLKLRALGGFHDLSALVAMMGQQPGIGPLESLSLAPEANVPGSQLSTPPRLVMQAQWPLILQPRAAAWIDAYAQGHTDHDQVQPQPQPWRWRAHDPFALARPTPRAQTSAAQATPVRFRGRVQQGSEQWALIEWEGRTHAVQPGDAVATSGWRLQGWLANGGLELSRPDDGERRLQLQAPTSQEPARN